MTRAIRSLPPPGVYWWTSLMRRFGEAADWADAAPPPDRREANAAPAANHCFLRDPSPPDQPGRSEPCPRRSTARILLARRTRRQSQAPVDKRVGQDEEGRDGGEQNETERHVPVRECDRGAIDQDRRRMESC